MADTKYAVKSGFYDSVNRDRLYSADDMNQPYKEILTEGIDAGGFEVTPQSTPNMTVNVAAGHAFLGGKWVDAVARTLTVPENTAMYGRDDAVVLQVDTNSDVREASIVYRTGTPAAIAEIPALINTGGISEVMLAYITVAAGATSISTSYIHDTRGGSDCPYADIKLGQLVREQQIAEDVSSWLTEHVNPVGSAVVVDDSLSIAGAAADAKATGDELTDLKSDLSLKTNNLLTDVEKVSNYIGWVTPTASDSYDYFAFVPVEANVTYYINFTARYVQLFDSSKSASGSVLERVASFTPTVDGYAHVTIMRTNPNSGNPKMYDSTISADSVLNYGDHFLNNKILAQKISDGVKGELKNIFVAKELVELFDASTAETGLLESSGSVSSSATNYKTTGYVPVKAGITYLIHYFRVFLAFDSSQAIVSGSWISTGTYDYEYTPNADGYIRWSYLSANESRQSIETYKTSDGYKTKEGIELSNLQKNQVKDLISDYSGNHLIGKKYIATGDSYTEWSDATFADGVYIEQTVTYDREIRRRNNMDGSNIAVSGTTMALSKNGDATIDANAFANTKYQSIPSDTDYLTISYGINDATYCNLGTKGDTTNATFWGAWDVVLNWFAENRPQMKIGIIIFQRGDNDFYQAVKEIAEYYGVPYIDFYGGKDTPMYVDGKAYAVDATLKATRKDYFCGHAHVAQTDETFQGVAVKTKIVEANPTHPGYRAHIDESTIIEEFLKRL